MRLSRSTTNVVGMWKEKLGVIQGLAHFACAVEPDPEVRLRGFFRQPCFQIRLSFVGSRSLFTCRHANDLQPAGPVFLLQMYQIGHRLHTMWTRGAEKLENIHMFGLEVREGLAS